MVSQEFEEEEGGGGGGHGSTQFLAGIGTPAEACWLS